MTAPTQFDPTPLDPWHAAIVDARMALDATRVEELGHGFVRLAVDHEMCPPGQACVTWPTVVMVVPIAPGVRLRVPYDGLVAV